MVQQSTINDYYNQDTFEYIGMLHIISVDIYSKGTSNGTINTINGTKIQSMIIIIEPSPTP